MKPLCKSIQIFDPAMCCSTGVCGPDIDTKLVQFSSDLEWLKSKGSLVTRHNLSQNPGAFTQNDLVRDALTAKGEEALPLVIVDGKIVFSGSYPDRTELASAVGIESEKSEIVKAEGECCGESGCC